MPCMANHAPAVEPDPQTPPWRLTEALDEKLAELRGAGFEVLWIEACLEDLTRLVAEGGETAIVLDPDPGVDRAWYGRAEIRHTCARQRTWIFLRGEAADGEISAHVLAPPDVVRALD